MAQGSPEQGTPNPTPLDELQRRKLELELRALTHPFRRNPGHWIACLAAVVALASLFVTVVAKIAEREAEQRSRRLQFSSDDQVAAIDYLAKQLEQALANRPTALPPGREPTTQQTPAPRPSERRLVESERAFASCIGNNCEDAKCIDAGQGCEFLKDTARLVVDRNFDDTLGPQNESSISEPATGRLCVKVTARPSRRDARAEIGARIYVTKVCRVAN
jgi:hypothetical protein